MAASGRVRSPSPVAGPSLVPLGHHEGKPPIALVRPVIVIGSRSNARIHLVSSTVSKAHALLVRSGDRWYIRDLASRTKVIINGQPVRETMLEDGDELVIGKFMFRFRAGHSGEGSQPAPAAPGKLDVAGSDFPVPIDERVVLIGRRSSADIPLIEDSVSTAHAVIFESDGQRFIRDLGSRTGTFVNNVSTHQHQLAPGDTIRIGETEMRYQLNEVAPAAVAEEEPFAVDVEDRDLPPPARIEHDEPLGVELSPQTQTEPDPRHPLEVLPADVVAEALAEAEPDVPQGPVDKQEIPRAEIALEPAAPEPPAPIKVADESHVVAEDLTAQTERPAAASVEIEPLIRPGAGLAAQENDDRVDDLVREELPRRGWHAPAAEKPDSTPRDEEPAGGAALQFPDALSEIDAAAPVLDLSEAGPTSSDSNREPAGDPGEFRLPTEDLVDLVAPPPTKSEPFKPASLMFDVAPTTPATEAAEPPFEESGRESPTAKPVVDLKPAPREPELPATVVGDGEETTSHEESPRPLIAAIELPGAPPAIEPARPSPAVEEVQVLPEPAPVADRPAIADEPPVEVGAQSPVAELPAASPPKRRGRKKKEPAVRKPPVEPEPVAEAPAPPAPPSLLPTSVEEVIEATEPNKESALESAAAQFDIESLQVRGVIEAPAVDELTDTSFGRAVVEFAGDKVGDIVEAPAAPSSPAPTRTPDLPDSVLPLDASAAPAVDTVDLNIDELIDQTLAIEPPSIDVGSEAPLELALAGPADGPPVAAEPGAPSALAAEPAEPDAGEPTRPGASPQVPWGANQDNFLGGQPLDLHPQADAAVPGSDEAVQDLISELDSAAAAAEAATASPPAKPAEDELPPIVPAIPPRPRGLASRTKRKSREDQVAPLELGGAEVDSAKPAFQGLGMSGIREMDVFSQMSPPASDAPAPDIVTEPPDVEAATTRRARGPLAGHFRASGGTFSTADAESPDATTRLKVIPELPDAVDGVLIGEKRSPVSFAVERSEADAAAARRKHFRRAAGLVVAMLVLIGAAAYVIFNHVGVRTSVEGSFNYRNLASLTKFERQQFHQRQYAVLKDDSTFNAARRLLVQRTPGASYGFLESRRDYLKFAERAAFTDERPDVLTLHTEGNDPEDDRARVSAVMFALYEQTRSLLDDARRAREDFATWQRTLDAHQRQVDDLNREIEKLRLIGESRPTSEQITKLEQQIDELEGAWNNAVIAVKAAEGELARLRSAPAGDATPGAAPAAPVDEDERIKSMQAELQKLQEQVAATRAANSAQANDARKQLDAALETFQKRVADAQRTMNASPELVAFVQSAQKLQETTRQLTEDLIRRQEQQFGRLTSLKDSLNDKMEQRRIESWQNDKQLQDLTEQLAILDRKRNAALGGGLQKESDDLKVEIDLTNNMIKARRELLPGDSFYADAIKQLQVIIDSTQKNIEEDRKKTEALLTALQQGFTSSETVEKLPAEQKQLAEALQKQVEQINEARQVYNQAVDRGAADSDTQLKQQIATLQASIDARRHTLVEENVKNLKSQQEQTRLDAITTKQQELASMNDAEAVARKAYFDKHKELREAQNRIADAKANAEKLDALIRQKDVAQRSLESNISQQELKKRNVDRAVEPIEPLDKDVTVVTGKDMRLIYTLCTCGAIVVLFSIMILWTFHEASRQGPGIRVAAADLGPATDKPANGQDLGKPATGPQEDHQPAVV